MPAPRGGGSLVERAGLGVLRAAGVEIGLQQDLSGDTVAALLALLVGQPRLPQRGLGLGRREALVEVDARQPGGLRQPGAEGAHLRGLLSLAAVEMDRQT